MTSTNLTDDLLASFSSDLKLRGLAGVTIQHYLAQVGWFEEYQASQNKTLLDGDKESLKAFLGHLRGKDFKLSSIAHVFAALSSFYDFLEEDGRIEHNPVPAVRKRYVHSYKNNTDRDERRCISMEEASKLVSSILDSRDRAIVLLLLKTGVQRQELIALDVEDVDLIEKVITLKPTAKRTNRTLFFDEETAIVLQRWLDVRSKRGYNGGALFSTSQGRIDPTTVKEMVARHSRRVGIGDAKLGRDYITPHYFRVWFTTHLSRAGMKREFIQELRGDVGREAIDIYNRIDKEELRRSYLACIPQLGI